MTNDNVDYKALYEQVQHEAETARLEILRLRNKRFPIEMGGVTGFIKENYLVCIFCVMAVYYIGSLLLDFKRSYRGWKK